MCRLRGLPTNETEEMMRIRLCALEEYLVITVIQNHILQTSENQDD